MIVVLCLALVPAFVGAQAYVTSGVTSSSVSVPPGSPADGHSDDLTLAFGYGMSRHLAVEAGIFRAGSDGHRVDGHSNAPGAVYATTRDRWEVSGFRLSAVAAWPVRTDLGHEVAPFVRASAYRLKGETARRVDHYSVQVINGETLTILDGSDHAGGTSKAWLPAVAIGGQLLFDGKGGLRVTYDRLLNVGRVLPGHSSLGSLAVEAIFRF